ncbi:MAG TPA: Crp/Fnr family transcriptional regulator [Chitinophagaceae bacterium]|nr:Crp/Fnr family transcriptional regulator [Chitinophagaceae bacterium]
MQEALLALQVFMLQMVKLEDAAWTDMQQRLIVRKYKKKALFIEEGKVCREIGFIGKGSFRYYKLIDGIEVSTFFSFEHNWVSSYVSFLRKAPSFVTVEAMEDCEVLVLSYDDMQYLYNRYITFERFGRLMAEYLVGCLDDRMHSLLLKTPEERYLKTLTENSIYFERVPLHYVASYLGIAPESLSRIRKRVMQKAIS